MAKCEVCGQGTFGRVCGRCQKMGKAGLVDQIKKEADEKGYDVVWSPVNQAWVIIVQAPNELRNIELVGVKNTIEEVREWINDDGEY